MRVGLGAEDKDLGRGFGLRLEFGSKSGFKVVVAWGFVSGSWR